MLDVTKNEYLDLGMPNIKGEWNKLRNESPSDADIQIRAFMQPFVLEAAKLWPMWTFVGKRFVWTSQRAVISGISRDRYEYSQFAIYDNREHIGTIDCDANNDNSLVYTIHNDRIQNKRERGTASKTKDLKKALKILRKEFGAKRLDERVEEAWSNCDSRLDNLFHTKSRDFDRVYAHVVNCLEEYMMTNWETIKPIALTNGADQKAVDSITPAYEDYMVVKRISTAFGDKKGVVVVIHGNDYTIKSKDGIEVCGTDKLPEWIKRGVGMLKLIEQNHVVGGIGFKIEENAFFVMEGSE